MSGAAAVRQPARAGPQDRPVCREFIGEPEQVAQVRDFVSRRLRPYGCPEEALEEIKVCVSEIATNAIRYTLSYLRREFDQDQGHFVVTIRVNAPTVRIEVADAGPAEDRVFGDDEDDDFGRGGRGLLLVSALAQAMGYDRTAFGGLTWFEYTWGTRDHRL